MTEIRSAVDFYARHPISAEIILAKLQEARGNLDNVKPEELFAHDQDHYGGLAVNELMGYHHRLLLDRPVSPVPRN